jgi:large subunit ribosomal protein L30
MQNSSNNTPSAGSDKRLRVTYSTSSIGVEYDQKDTVRRLGLRKLGRTVELPDSPAVRGMLHKVRHLVTVEEVTGTEA